MCWIALVPDVNWYFLALKCFVGIGEKLELWVENKTKVNILNNLYSFFEKISLVLLVSFEVDFLRILPINIKLFK